MDKFHDFLSLFVFYKFFKQLYGKFTAMLSEHSARSFRSAPEIGRNLCYVAWISFLHARYSKFRVICSSNVIFFEEIQINELNLLAIENTVIIVLKWYM